MVGGQKRSFLWPRAIYQLHLSPLDRLQSRTLQHRVSTTVFGSTKNFEPSCMGPPLRQPVGLSLTFPHSNNFRLPFHHQVCLSASCLSDLPDLFPSGLSCRHFWGPRWENALSGAETDNWNQFLGLTLFWKANTCIICLSSSFVFFELFRTAYWRQERRNKRFNTRGSKFNSARNGRINVAAVPEFTQCKLCQNHN